MVSVRLPEKEQSKYHSFSVRIKTATATQSLYRDDSYNVSLMVIIQKLVLD